MMLLLLVTRMVMLITKMVIHLEMAMIVRVVALTNY